MRRPERRSRKIGLTQGGRVRDGKAYEKWSRIFTREVWERLSEREDESSPIVLRENPSGAFYHPCRGIEYVAVLRKLPNELQVGVRAIVLRRTPKIDAQLGVEARRRYGCVILNAFPRHQEMRWEEPAALASRRHYGRWCSNWNDDGTVLAWDKDGLRNYYLYHLFLHEVGHINQPWFHSHRRREEYAENFALEWASRLGELPPPFSCV